MKAMILAAGLGNRMRPLTDHTPKPLIGVNGKPLIEYHLENLQRAGIRDVVINLAYLGEKIRSYLGNGEQWNLQIRYSQEPEPLETGGALSHALDLLGDKPFLLINGDVWCELEFKAFVSQALRTQGHLLLVPNPVFHPHGDFALDDTGTVLADPQTNSQKFTFAGISLLVPELITMYPERREKFPLVEVFRHAIAQRQLTGQLYHGHWSDVGTPERLYELETHLSGRGTSD